ncbi:DeoR family transcriptional regulator, partial [Streptomyces griseus]|nr:DeoR family transcriptional regulator [Streptomyces griseus]
MREGAAERHDRLLNLVRERGTVRVSDLADRLGVATVTARRDVEVLASRGLLERAHGSVSWPADRGPAGTPVGGGPVIGMLAPAAAYYFAEVIRGAHEAAARLGARLILRVTDYRAEDDAAHAA